MHNNVGGFNTTYLASNETVFKENGNKVLACLIFCSVTVNKSLKDVSKVKMNQLVRIRVLGLHKCVEVI